MHQLFMGSETKSFKSRLFVPSLVLSAFATQPPNMITSLLLIEIGLSFGVPVGVSGQLRTISSIMGVIIALTLGVLNQRFNSKSIMIAGELMLVLSAFGCAYASSFNSLLIAYSIAGIGITMITPMMNTIIGNNVPQEDRPRVLGLSAAGNSGAYVICSPLIGYISGIYVWRVVFLILMLPVSFLTLVTSFIGLPSEKIIRKVSIQQLTEGYKAVLGNRSAFFSLLGTMLSWTAFLGSLTYMMSYFRQELQVALGLAGILFAVLALSKMLGHLTIGRVIKRFGRKNTVVGSIFAMTILSCGYLLVDILWLSLFFSCFSCLMAGYMHSSVDSLNIEQLKEYRGSMMSLSFAFYTLGGVLGAGLGGYALMIGGYRVLAALIGVFGLVSGYVFHQFTRES